MPFQITYFTKIVLPSFLNARTLYLSTHWNHSTVFLKLEYMRSYCFLNFSVYLYKETEIVLETKIEIETEKDDIETERVAVIETGIEIKRDLGPEIRCFSSLVFTVVLKCYLSTRFSLKISSVWLQLGMTTATRRKTLSWDTLFKAPFTLYRYRAKTV